MVTVRILWYENSSVVPIWYKINIHTLLHYWLSDRAPAVVSVSAARRTTEQSIKGSFCRLPKRGIVEYPSVAWSVVRGMNWVD